MAIRKLWNSKFVENVCCTVETTKSKYGFAYRTGNHFADFGLPKTAKEIWAKCDAYFTENYSDGDRIGLAHRQTADNGSTPDCGFWSGQNKITNNGWFFVNESTSSREISDSSFEKKLNTLLFATHEVRCIKRNY